jgi:endonuclease YncB( thermonuclease family)
MNKATFEDVLEQALELEPDEQTRLVEQLMDAARTVRPLPRTAADDSPDLDDELAELLRSEPMTGAEIVAAGLAGTWADLGIRDGAVWVNEQKQKRRKRNQW